MANHKEKPLVTPIEEIHRRWPSTAWDENDWIVALQDDELFNRILDGMAIVSTRFLAATPQHQKDYLEHGTIRHPRRKE